MERVVRHFQEEMDVLKSRLLEMGGLAEQRVRRAVQGLAEREYELIESVLTGDEPINALQLEVDDRCLKLLALHQPMATDLRAVMAAVKINTDLDGRALNDDGSVIPGLFAAGEASGFGGGGVHGYRALEGTFLGGCLFSGRQAGRAAAS
jgi:predicted oxidoreductase